MPFLYHTSRPLPNKKSWPACLSHLAGCDLHVRQVNRGPKGAGDGVVFAPKQFLDLGDVAYVDSLKFRPLAGANGAYSVALVEPIPALDKLAREQPVDGPRLLLDDGRRWQIPRVRYWVADGDRPAWGTNVPQQLELSDDDELIRGDPLPQFRGLWDTAQAWNKIRLGSLEESEQQLWGDVRTWLTAAAAIVGGNYHVGLRELLLCGALRSQQTAERILDAAIDLAGLADLQKKSQAISATPSGSPGPADSPPATPPASPT